MMLSAVSMLHHIFVAFRSG